MPETMKKSGMLTAVFLGSFIVQLNMSIVTVALPAIQSSLKTDVTGLQWVVNAYILCLSAFMLSGGTLGDRYGRKRLWLWGVAVFTVGSALCGAASGLPLLIGGRIVQGIAAALMVPGAMSILAQAYPDPAERARIIGWWGTFGSLSTVVGPVIGGFLVDLVGWPSIFSINLPLGILTFIFSVSSIRESADPDETSLDLPGQLLGTVWLGALSYALITGRGAGWLSPFTLVCLGVALVTFLAFVAVELRQPKPMLPVRLFTDARFAVTNAASFVLGFGAYSVFFFLSLYLQQVQGYTATAAGLRYLPLCGAISLASFYSGRLSGRFGPQASMLAGYLITGIALAGMYCFGPDTGYAVVAFLFAILGIGMGLSIPATVTAVFIGVPRERSGMASGTVNATRQAGTALGVALLGTVLTAQAVSTVTAALKAIPVPPPFSAQLAEDIIAHNGTALTSAYPIDPGLAVSLFRQAFTAGLNTTALITGIVTVVIALVIYRTKWRAS